MERSAYDVVIVGNGISGSTAAIELDNKDDCSVCVIDPKNYSSDGVGERYLCTKPNNGKFIFSSNNELETKPHYRRPGGELQNYFYESGKAEECLALEERAQGLLRNWVEDAELNYEEYPPPEKMEEIKEFIKKCNPKGIEVTVSDILSLGGVRNTYALLNHIYQRLNKECSNVDVVNGEVKRVVPDKNYVVLNSGDRIKYREAVLLACGREGVANGIYDDLKARGYLWEKEGKKNLLVGVVLEAPSTIFPPAMNYMGEPKLTMGTKKDDIVRTFGYYPNGRVAVVDYGNGIKSVSGIIDERRKSNNTVMGLVMEVRFTEPFEDAPSYGRDIFNLTLKLGGKKPLVQRLRDYEMGRRSTEERIKKAKLVKPTLSFEEAIPGDISMAYPGRIISNLYDGINKLNRVIEGISEESLLMYAPLIVLKPSEINVDPFTMKLETEKKLEGEMYVLGDMNGICKGNADAMISGIIAADSIRKG